MKVLIEIAENNYKEMCEHGIERVDFDIQRMMKNGTPIPDNATNKDVMCAFFGQVTLDKCMCIDPKWWNAPYKADKE